MLPISKFLGRLSLKHDEGRTLKEKCLTVFTKFVAGGIKPEDFEIDRRGVLRLGVEIGASARSEIYLHKKEILYDLSTKIGKGAPSDIR